MKIDMLEQAKAVNWKQASFITLVSLLLALAHFRLVSLVMPQYKSSVDAALGVIQGHPHWIVYQNRLLGPYSVKVLSLFLGDFQISHSLFIIVMVTTSCILMFVFVSREYGRESAWSALFLMNLLLALCNNKFWLYTWDYWDIILFLLFTYFVFSEKPWIWFLALGSVAVFNREGAFFIALWMILDPIVKHLLCKNGSQLNWKLFVSGIAVLGVGLLIIFSLRYLLLVEEIMLVRVPDAAPKSHFNIQLWYNLDYVKNVLLTPEPDLVVPIFLLAVLLLAVVVSFRDPLRLAALGLTYGALTICIFVFGFLPETRLTFELIPFVAFGSSFIRAEQPKSFQ